MKLSGQRKQVYDYIKANPGCTVREMGDCLVPGVDKVSARLSEINQLYRESLGKPHDKSIKLIVGYERNRYREMKYRIGQPLTKKVQRTEMTPAGVKVWYEEVPI